MPPDPWVLAFDTSAAHCAVALLAGKTRRVCRVDSMVRGQAEHLMPMLETVLAEAGITWRDLNLIAVGTGPGNFTGIRISVAAARGLALALAIPAIGVSGFDTLAHGQAGPLWSVIPARRGHFYARYDEGPITGVPLQLSAPELDQLTGQKLCRTDVPAETFVENIARVSLGRADRAQPRPAPLYVRPPDAAPSNITAPILLT